MVQRPAHLALNLLLFVNVQDAGQRHARNDAHSQQRCRKAHARQPGRGFASSGRMLPDGELPVTGLSGNDGTHQLIAYWIQLNLQN